MRMLRVFPPPAMATALLCVAFLPCRGAAQTADVTAGTTPMVWPACAAEQLEVMILGTFHFHQTSEIDVLEPHRQAELEAVTAALAGWRPTRVAVEFAHAETAELSEAYRRFRSEPVTDSGSKNEIRQLGFRLAHHLNLDEVDAVDVPMNLWHDSITVFDETWPESRDALRSRWPWRYPEASRPADASRSIPRILIEGNRDDPPANHDMFGNFVPLVEGEVYAGALKLTPWYDRNLRILQNVLRSADSADDRILLIIGWGHLRTLKQMMEITPQLCPVSALPTLEAIPAPSSDDYQPVSSPPSNQSQSR